MIRKLKTATSLIYLFVFFVFTACNKNEIETQKGVVQFSFELSENDGARTTQEISFDKIIISIESESGELVLEDEELSLSFKDADYITDPISLNIGSYAIVKFLVVGEDGVVQYATPLEGSDLAYLVETPLPIEFTVSKDEVTQIIPEVVSTEEGTVEDFGYGEFTFNIIETFDVLVGVFVYDAATSAHVLTSSDIVIYADGDSLTSKELFAATNKLTFPDRFDEFQLIIEKEGYNTFDYTYSADSIKSYQGNNANGPLEIVLISEGVTEGLVAYYPFNGNANDESGNGNNGVVNGANLTEDRDGNLSAAYSFDGQDDYIRIPHSEMVNFTQDQNFAISLWVNVPENQNNTSSSQNSFIAKEGSGQHQFGYPFVIRLLNSSREVVFRRWDGTGCGNGSTSSSEEVRGEPQTADQWYHIVAMKNGSNLLLFVNGQLFDTVVDSTSEECDTKNDFDIIIGQREGNARTLTGKIDEIRFYNRVLTEKEIVFLSEN